MEQRAHMQPQSRTVGRILNNPASLLAGAGVGRGRARKLAERPVGGNPPRPAPTSASMTTPAAEPRQFEPELPKEQGDESHSSTFSPTEFCAEYDEGDFEDDFAEYLYECEIQEQLLGDAVVPHKESEDEKLRKQLKEAHPGISEHLLKRIVDMHSEHGHSEYRGEFPRENGYWLQVRWQLICLIVLF